MKIALIGDTINDIYTYCNKRNNPETNMPCYTSYKQYSKKGGVWNVYNILKNTFNVDLYTSKLGSCKERIYCNDKYVCRLDKDVFEKIKYPKNFEKIYDWYIISDYKKGIITEDLIKKLDMNKVIVDTKPDRFDWFKNSKILKINEIEYKLNKNIDVQNLIVTLGDKGAMVNNKIIHQLNPTKNFDVIGAGDRFLAYFSEYYLIDGDLYKSVKYANKMVSKSKPL
jgi:bifunctional ADP-heptose synthase (sugar kinase/adenylyltransferase)